MNNKTKQKWRRLDAEGFKLFKEMLIMFTPKVDNPASKIWRILKEDCVVLIRENTLDGKFDCRVSFNKEEEDYEMTHIDVVHQAQEALKKWGYTQHPVFAVKTMTDLWKLYSKEVK